MPRKDYQRYDPGTTVNFRPTQYPRAKTPWYRYVPGFLVMAPAAAFVTVIVTAKHLNVILQMVLVVGLAFLAKAYVDWRMGVL